jgi:hypothetical protein
MRRSAATKLACSAADRHRESDPPAELGDRHGHRRRSADHDFRMRQDRLDEHVHGALARAHVLGEAHAGALLAGRDALLLQRVRRLYRDEAGLAVGQRLARRLEHRGAGAAAADPAFGNSAVRQDHRLRSGLGGGGGHRAHDGGERERLARGLAAGDGVQNVACLVHGVRSWRGRVRARPGSRGCGRARTDRHAAAPPACRALPGGSPASRSAG